tara:strand:- start:63098 stop:63574 length:477 start_codon:yes stop_codon:yes gene_type:complete
MASVKTGDIIKAELINKILDIEVSTGENSCSVIYNRNGAQESTTATYTEVSNSCGSSIPLTVSSTTIGLLTADYSSLNLQNIPALSALAFHHVSQSGFTTVSFSTSPTNQNGYFYSVGQGGSFNPLTFHLKIERMGSDRFQRKTLRNIIEDLNPNFFD